MMAGVFYHRADSGTSSRGRIRRSRSVWHSLLILFAASLLLSEPGSTANAVPLRFRAAARHAYVHHDEEIHQKVEKVKDDWADYWEDHKEHAEEHVEKAHQTYHEHHEEYLEYYQDWHEKKLEWLDDVYNAHKEHHQEHHDAHEHHVEHHQAWHEKRLEWLDDVYNSHQEHHEEHHEAHHEAHEDHVEHHQAWHEKRLEWLDDVYDAHQDHLEAHHDSHEDHHEALHDARMQLKDSISAAHGALHDADHHDHAAHEEFRDSVKAAVEVYRGELSQIYDGWHDGWHAAHEESGPSEHHADHKSIHEEHVEAYSAFHADRHEAVQQHQEIHSKAHHDDHHHVAALRPAVFHHQLHTTHIGEDETLAGSGTMEGDLSISGTLSPGNSPGTRTIDGSATWEAGGSYKWEINDAYGGQGEDPGWDLFEVTGTLSINATLNDPFTIDIVSLALSNEEGLLYNFAANEAYEWTIATAEEGVFGFDDDLFRLDASGFLNPLFGTFALELAGSDINLTYTGFELAQLNSTAGMPEPSSLLLLTLGLAGPASRRRRRIRPRCAG